MEGVLVEVLGDTVDQHLTGLADAAAQNHNLGIHSGTQAAQELTHVVIDLLQNLQRQCIPGIAGIGEKTAQSLIQNFGSLDGIYENIEDKRITKGVREKLLRDKDNAYLSRTLARIITDAPLEGDLESLAMLPRDEVGLYKKFTELELNSLIQKFGLTGKSEAEAGVADAEAFVTSFTDITAEELDGISDDRIALEVRPGEIYISAGGRNLRLVGGRVEFSRWIEGKSVICYDGKAQLHALDKMGIDATRVKFLDLMLYAYVINPGSGHGGAPALASMFLGKTVEAEGYFYGTITENPRGERGFGYDPLFIPLGENRTVAEMTDEEKNAISHRANALALLLEKI